MSIQKVALLNDVRISGTTDVQITNPIEINEIQNVVNVDSVDLVDQVSTVSSVTNVANVSNVDVAPDPFLMLMDNKYSNYSPIQVYSYSVSDGTNYKTFHPGGTVILPLMPSAGATLAFSADFASLPAVNFNIIITYYETSASTTTSTIIVTTDDENKVVIPGTVFHRFENIQVAPNQALPSAATVYFYDSSLNPVGGVPPSYYDLLRAGSDLSQSNARETAIVYCPTGKNIIAKSWWVTANQNSNSVREILFRLVLSDNVTYYQRRFFITNSNLQIKMPQLRVPENSTIHILFREGNGTNQVESNLNMELVRMNVP